MEIKNNKIIENNNSLINESPHQKKPGKLEKFGKKIVHLLGKFHLGKEILYQFSLFSTGLKHSYNSKKYPWWNRIVTPLPSKIILGAIPLKNKKHPQKILKEVGSAFNNSTKLSILTLLESFEIKSNSPFAKPVKPRNWEKMGVNQKIINAEDFKPLTQEEIQEAVAFLEEQHRQGIPTYVHCKAGRGRSATAVICFLMMLFKLSAEEAIKIVKESRPLIHLNKEQWEAIKTYEAFLRQKN